MSDDITNTAILWEYDKPVSQGLFTNYLPGIWYIKITPGVITILDDYGYSGYYNYNNENLYTVSSIMVNGVNFLEVDEIDDLYLQDESFYFNSGNTFLYVAFKDYTNPFSNALIFLGLVAGFSKNLTDPYLNNVYYDPRISNIFGVKKSKDPLFYGLLKFNSGSVKLINNDGAFDDWRDRNLYRQPTRNLIGQNGDAYSSYTKVFTGIIGNDSRTWDELFVKVEDVRAGLTNPLPANELTQTDYPNMSDSNKGKFKPIAYGDILGGACICLNKDESPTPANYTFLFMDTEFNSATAITEVRVDGTVKSTVSTSLSAGTFTLSAASVGDNFSEVFCDFTGANIKNGVDIIKDLMLNYADTSYISANYDLTETAAAQALSRDTSVYYKSQVKLNKVIEQICVDIDALFFAKDDGRYTVRVYDVDREPVKTIYFDEWFGDPEIENNADEFLSSVIIGHSKNNANDETIKYNETSYTEEVFDNYKSLQSKEIITNLTSEADAILKAQTVMETSKLVQDIVKRNTGFQHIDLEIMDFIICDPRRRFSGQDRLGVWEVVGINKNFDDLSIQLSLRYIKTYTHL